MTASTVRIGTLLSLFAIGLGVSVAAADAHVKWFAPYIVGTSPAPIVNTITNPWFWVATGLVLVFFWPRAP